MHTRTRTHIHTYTDTHTVTHADEEGTFARSHTHTHIKHTHAHTACIHLHASTHKPRINNVASIMGNNSTQLGVCGNSHRRARHWREPTMPLCISIVPVSERRHQTQHTQSSTPYCQVRTQSL